MGYFRELGSLGINFFIIQIAVLFIFQTSNIIIAQVLGPTEVTLYNIAFKYFSVITMFFGIIITPFWSAYTEAYIKDDILWIRKTTKKLLQIWSGIVLVVFLMILFSDTVYKIWLHNTVRIPFVVSVLMGIFVLVCTWNNIFVFFINGIGKIQLQLRGSIIIALINIPLSIFFAKNLSLGIAGIILANCLSLGCGSILAPMQYFKLINKTARGIWVK
jgi:O-antigen/teichoic acid export membrane protein